MPSKRPRFPLLPWRSRAAIARDVDDELSFHLEMRVSELTAHGMGPDEARRRAVKEFGDIDLTRAYCRDLDARTERDTRLTDRLADWRQDAWYALRTLRRAPAFAAVSLLTLALAIGANTAIFSVAQAVLLKPLPYGDADALMSVSEGWPGHPGEHTPLSPPNFVDYRAQQQAFTDIAAYAGIGSVTWRPAIGDPVTVSAVGVAPNVFSVLRVSPLHGRVFPPGADQPGHDREVVVTYRFWQRLGGDVASVGRRITLNNQPYTLIGVMPRGFTIGLDDELWLPLDMSDDLARPAITRKQHWVHAVGRLKPGMTAEAALADLQTLARRLEAQYPDANAGRSAVIKPLRDVMIGNLRPALLLLQGAAAIVLLIACANLANLTLSRTIGRRREMALRAALGAGRGRLVRQLLTESVLLAMVGGAAGVGLAMLATRTLLALNPDVLPPTFVATIDTRVLFFSLALSVGTGVLFGLVPALDVARADLHHSIKEGGRGTSGGHRGEHQRRALVVTQMALAVMLLIGAGLLVRSFGELTRASIGFDPDHVLTAQLRASGGSYDTSANVNRFYDAVLGDIANAPGVVAVGAASALPTQGHVGTSLRIEGAPTDEKRLPDMGYVGVRGDYFKAMRIPLLAGRVYNASDVPGGPKTVIINDAAARQFFPDGDAIGRRIRIGPNPNGEWLTIIGVVGDVRDEGLDIAARPALFANHRQEAWERSLAIVIRTSGDPLPVAPVLRRAIRSADPTLAVRDIRTLDAVVGSSLAPRRFALGLTSSFAGLALLLAAVGIYGVLAYMVSNRSREFGVRLALGATTRGISMLVLRQGLGWSLLGIAVGVAGALAGARLLTGMLYGVSPLDPSTYVWVSVGLLGVAVAACLVPAARATRVDPLASMRAE